MESETELSLDACHRGLQTGTESGKVRVTDTKREGAGIYEVNRKGRHKKQKSEKGGKNKSGMRIGSQKNKQTEQRLSECEGGFYLRGAPSAISKAVMPKDQRSL